MADNEVIQAVWRVVRSRLLLMLVVGVAVILICQLPLMIELVPARTAEGTAVVQPTLNGSRYLEHVVTFPVRAVTKGDLVNYVADAWLRSATLLFVGLGFAVVVGTLVGMFSGATMRGRSRKWLLSGTFVTLAIPDFMFVVMMQRFVVSWYRIFGVQLLPILSDLSPKGWIMPTLAVGLLPAAFLARMTAIAVDDINRQDYVRTAHSKGVHPIKVMFGHVLKNAVPRVAAMVPNAASFAISALLVAEWLTNYAGLGFQVLLGVRFKDAVASTDRMTASALLLVVTYVLLDTAIRGVAALLRGPETRSEAEGLV